MEIKGEILLERYRDVMDEAPIATVDIIFLDPEKKKTLLGKRTNEPYAGSFYSFGGRLYKNEELTDAALRIAKKETGLSLKVNDIIQAGVLNEINPNSVFEGINYHAVNIYFACIIKEETVPSLDEQHSEAKWFDVHDGSIHPYVRRKIEGALRAL